MIKKIYVLYVLALSAMIPAQLSAGDFFKNHPAIVVLGSVAAGGIATHVVKNQGTSIASAAADGVQERTQELLDNAITSAGKELTEKVLPATETSINSVVTNTGKQLTELISNMSIEVKSLFTHTNKEVMPLLTHTNGEVKSLLTHTNGEIKSLLTHTNNEIMPLLSHTNGEVKSLLSHTNTEVQSLSTHLNNELKSTFSEGVQKLDTTSNSIMDRAVKEGRSFAKSIFVAGLCSLFATAGLKILYDGFQECFAEENENKSKTKPIIKMSVGGVCFAAALYGVYKQFD